MAVTHQEGKADACKFPGSLGMALFMTFRFIFSNFTASQIHTHARLGETGTLRHSGVWKVRKWPFVSGQSPAARFSKVASYVSERCICKKGRTAFPRGRASHLFSWETSGEKLSGNSVRQYGQCICPRVRQVRTQPRQNTWSQGRQTGSCASPRQMGHGSTPNLESKKDSQC